MDHVYLHLLDVRYIGGKIYILSSEMLSDLATNVTLNNFPIVLLIFRLQCMASTISLLIIPS